MAYNANTKWDNERSYLNGLISKGGGNAEWAKKQMGELNKAQQQYGGSSGSSGGGTTVRTPSVSTPSDAELRNRYFPGANVIPSGVNLAAGTTRAPNGDILPLHDWSTDTTDYGQLMLNAKDINEFREAAQARVNKANAQGINIMNGDARTNEDLYNEWRKKSGYAPNYGDFVYKGWGHNSMTDTDGWIDNAGQGTGYYGMDGEGHWGYYEDAALTKKLANGTWDDYASSDGGYVRMDDTGQPDMTQRDMSRAGQTVILTSPKGTWECTYGDNGYITRRLRTSSRYTPGLTPAKADNDAGVSSEDLLYLDTGHRYAGPGSDLYNKDIRAASRKDYENVMAWRKQNGLDSGSGSSGTDAGMGGRLPDASGAGVGAGTGVSGGIPGGGAGGISGGGVNGGGHAPDLRSTLDKWLEAAKTQLEQKVDYATSNGINELQRAQEDAQGQFQTQRNQIAADAAKASDNQALYNERAGDRGGIGAAQYDSIANTAAQNQLTVNQAQTKLSTDTARQIADLRAQGEFTKADQLLQLSQNYLQQLISIQQWSAEFNLSVDQFNKQIEQWNREYELRVGELLGSFRGQPTLGSQQLALNKNAQLFDQEYKQAGLTGTLRGQPTLEARASLAEAGLALAQSGIMPSQSQLEAMKSLYGYDSSAVTSLVQTAKLAAQSKLSGGSGYKGGSKNTGKSTGKTSSGEPNVKTNTSQWLAYHGYDNYQDAYDALRLQGFDDDIAESRANAYMKEINKYVDSNSVTYDTYQSLYRTLVSLKQTKGVSAARSYFENNILTKYVIPDRWLNDLMSLVGYKG